MYCPRAPAPGSGGVQRGGGWGRGLGAGAGARAVEGRAHLLVLLQAGHRTHEEGGQGPPQPLVPGRRRDLGPRPRELEVSLRGIGEGDKGKLRPDWGYLVQWVACCSQTLRLKMTSANDGEHHISHS